METTSEDCEKFYNAYVEAIYFTDTGDTYQPSNSIELSDKARIQCRHACNLFINHNINLLATIDAEQAGHDFWLTRNGHGAGFWSRNLGEIGKLLTAACKQVGDCDTYQGDDGMLHIHKLI